MTAQRILTATSVVALLAGLLAPAATAAPPTVRLAMHDMMNMPGMKGGGMGAPAQPTPPAHQPAAPGAAPHAPAGKGPGAHGPAATPPGDHVPPGPAMAPQGHGSARTMIDLPTDRIEGRIAFLHAELRITEAQMPAWSEFANAIRANAKRMTETQAHGATPPTALDWLNQHERWLAARLDSVRALKATYTKLHAVLDESQRKTGDQLVAHQMGIR